MPLALLNMRSYSLIAPAKINLHLEIIGDRPDGFHELAMIMQTVTLADRITLRSISTDTIQLRCDHAEVPQDRTNLAYRAAELMIQQFPEAFAQFGGVEITIDKRIPIGAGLAGGSADAASVLVGLDLLWQLGLTKPELQDLAALLGSDIPFCVTGGSAIATGRGEKLSPIVNKTQLYVILAKYRSLSVSTAWAYQTYRASFHDTYIADTTCLETRRQRVHSGDLVQALVNQNLSQIGQLLYNDLEKTVLPAHPEVEKLKQAFAAAGVLGTMMSGSGPTVFALVETATEAQRVQQAVADAIANPDLDLWVAQFCNHGIQIANAE